MIKENQRRLEETNKRMSEMVVRQEKEIREKEDAWATEISYLRQVSNK